MKFTFIPGLTEVKSMLIDSVKSNHNAHAQLFLGKEGALNLPLALAYTTYLHCQNKGETDSCGTCPACVKSLKYIHPDTNFVFPVSNIKGDKDLERFKADMLKNWRQFLIEQPFGHLDDWTNFYGGEDKQAIISRDQGREIIQSLSLKPFESQFKVMLVWQPEYMHPAASNGILKILEEPPPNTFFFLVTNGAERLLPTILSRTQIIQVPMLTDQEVNQYLLTQPNLEETRRNKIVQQVEGNLNFAIKLIGSEEDHNQEIFTDWMRSCFKNDYSHLVGLADTFHELDKMSQRNLLHYGQSMLRETLLHYAGATEINRATGNELKFIQDFSKVMTTAKIEKSNQLMDEATYYLERNGSAKMIFMDLSLQLSNVIK